jgi:radical SAM protein with 4Fe4S-binding SPASM domain
MIGILRNFYSKQKLIRGVKIDRLLQKTYARWLSHGNAGKIFTVFTEISSKCNLSCENCYRTKKEYASKNKNMELDTFKKIVDSMPPGIQYLVTQGFGESAFNPDLKTMLQYAKSSRKFQTIILDTNLLLKTSDYYASLFKEGLDRLIVSVDSFDPLICEQLRQGTAAKILIKNLTDLIKTNHSHVHVRITVSKKNIDDLENTLNRLKEMNVQRIEIGMIVDYYENNISLDSKDEEKIISITKKFPLNILLDKYSTCILPFTAISFNVSGNIMPCCRIFDDEIIHFGNIDSGLESTYYSDEFNRIRSSFYKKMPTFCYGCPHYQKL